MYRQGHKAHKPYEFSCKVSVTITNAISPGGMFVLLIRAYHGNPYDGHTLSDVIKDLTHSISAEPERIYVGKGYRGHNAPNKGCVSRSGQKRGVHGTIKKELRRRSAVEPIIGHLKAAHRLDRNYLKGRQGCRINAILAAAGYNFKRIAVWLKALLAKIVWRWTI